MSCLHGSSQAADDLARALGLPAKTVGFVLRVYATERATVTVERHANESEQPALANVLQQFKLVPIGESEALCGKCGHPEACAAMGCKAREAQPVAVPQEPLVRFCPGCGSVGDVEEKFRDCCPDGGHARMVPQSLAHRCHDLFRLALDGVLRTAQPASDIAAPGAAAPAAPQPADTKE